MVEASDLVAKVVASIAPVVAKEGIDAFTMMARKAIGSFQQRRTMKTDELTQLVELIKKNPPPLAQMETNIDTLSRWFEIPRDDFEKVPKDKLDAEVLIRHVFLEQLFADWFEEFGYNVTIGSKMLGVEGWEFIPDVYAEMSTLHGIFQVAVNFICDDPPSTSRISFLCESLEAFATRREPEFSEKDIFMLVTPFKFSATAHSVILKEDKDHTYYVVKLESTDLYALQQTTESDYRLRVLQNIVKEAYGPSARKTWI